MRDARRMMRPLIIAAAIVVVLAVGIWLFVGSPGPASQERAGAPGKAKEQAKDHKPEAGPHAEDDIVKLTAEQRQALGVKVEPVQARVPQARLNVTGTIAPNPDRTVVVAPRTQGRVIKVLARLGDTVDAGAPLALVDSAEAADQLGELAQADSALALAEAKAEQEQRLYEAKLRVTETARQQPTAEAAMKELAKVELGRAKQEYISALAKAELAQADHERAKLLVEQKVGARKDLIRAEKELFSARSEVDAVAETIRLTARQDLLGAQTALAQARAQRDRIREKLRLLGFTDSAVREMATAPDRRLVPLVAPFSATVIERQITEGQLVDPSSTSFRLADLRTVWALLDVPESEIGAVRAGQDVVVEAGREGRVRHTGRVVYLADVVEEQTRTVKVRVEIPNRERHFKPGMFVTAQIASRPAGAAVLMVPKDAVFVMDEGPVVFVEAADGFRSRALEIGQEIGGWVPVQKGLKPGEKVVTAGGFGLKAQLVKAKLGKAH